MMKRFSILIVFLFGLMQAYAQDRSITGTVVDETGVGMPGATVQIKGTAKGTVTDVNGAYVINAATDAVLQISYVGYIVSEVLVGESNVYNVTLAPDVKSLDEIVVVGYGVQKKSLVTGAISKVKAEDIASQPSLRVEQALQGRTSGVVFNQVSGQPGAGITVRVRGVSSNGDADPLYIVDGMKSSKYVMNELSPSDIESVEVLKDGASAAIYGSEGANGVIIISTKKGGKKDKTIVQYDAYYGIQVPNYKNAMNADQYRDYFREAYAYDKLASDRSGYTGFQLPSTVTGKLWENDADSVTFMVNTTDYQYNLIKTKAPVLINQAIAEQDAQLAAGTLPAAKHKSNVAALNKKLEAVTAMTAPLSFNQHKANALNPVTGVFGKEIDTVGKGTNWMDELFRNAAMQSHHLSVQTSTEKSNLYLAASYFTQDGVVGGADNNFTRYNFRVNADHQAKDWLKVGTNITMAQSKTHNLAENNPYGGLIVAATAYDPTAPKYWSDTSQFSNFFSERTAFGKTYDLSDSMIMSSDGKWYACSSITEGESFNPLAKMEIRKAILKTTERALGNAYIEIQPFKELTFRSAAGGEVTYETDDDWQKAWYMTEAKNERGYIKKDINRYHTYQIDNTLSFAKTFGDHDISVLAGHSYSVVGRYSVNAERKDPLLFNEEFTYLDAVPVLTVQPKFATKAENELAWQVDNSHRQVTGGKLEQDRKLSYFGRFNYNYKEKYLLSATFRRDGSSMFAPGHKFGNFPSASIGWNVHKEDFFNIPAFSMLKARASWGSNGSIKNVRAYGWTTTSTYEIVGGEVAIKGSPKTNPDLIWEASIQSNVGVDMGFLKNKLTFSAEYYKKTTTDLLARPYANKWTTTAEYDANVGEVVNSGFEMDLGYANRESEFKYDVKLVASYLKNEVTQFIMPLPGYKAPATSTIHTYFEQGKPVYYFKGYKALGVFQNWEEIRNYTGIDPATGKTRMIQPNAQPGDAKIADVGGVYDEKGNPVSDAQITTLDMTDVGKPMPTWTFGFNYSCEYKGIDFGFFLYSELDKTIFKATLRERQMYNREEYAYTARWTEGSGVNDYPRAIFNRNAIGGSDVGGNSFFFEDGSYLRLKNITLGYTLPQDWTQKIQISKLRLYFTATNLLTITGYSGNDPEVGQSTDANSYGVDMGMYPSSQSFIGGINLTF